MTNFETVRVKVGPHGRIVIPAAMRKNLRIQEGEELIVSLEGDQIALRKQEAMILKLQSYLQHIPPDRSLADELIAERRAESRREME